MYNYLCIRSRTPFSISSTAQTPAQVGPPPWLRGLRPDPKRSQSKAHFRSAEEAKRLRILKPVFLPPHPKEVGRNSVPLACQGGFSRYCNQAFELRESHSAGAGSIPCTPRGRGSTAWAQVRCGSSTTPRSWPRQGR